MNFNLTLLREVLEEQSKWIAEERIRWSDLHHTGGRPKQMKLGHLHCVDTIV